MIVRTTTYSGTVEGFAMIMNLLVEKQYEEVIDGNTRRMEATGGLIVTATFDVDGEKKQVRALVTPVQVGQLTLQQVLDAAVSRLETALGV